MFGSWWLECFGWRIELRKFEVGGVDLRTKRLWFPDLGARGVGGSSGLWQGE